MTSLTVGLHRGEVESPGPSASRVRVQTFPLLADLETLQTFCDEWLNRVVPPSIAVFRPALPIVFCGVLHYPEMGDALPWQTGTMTQNEIYFLVPLERHREVGGALQFVEFCATTPYILVDNTESAVAGRERFGMPKQDAAFSTEWKGLPWPVGTAEYLSVSAWDPGVIGHQLSRLMDVVRNDRPPPHFGASGGDSPVPSPGKSMGPIMTWLARLVARGAFGNAALGDVASRASGFVSMLRSERNVNLFSLRQFADPEQPTAARYQDLVSFRMGLTDLQDVGLLGGDLSSAEFRLLLHRSDIRPIAKILGLKVAATSSDSDGSIDAVDSVAPFFVQASVELVESARLCWRGRETGWRDPRDGRPLSPPGVASYNRYLGPSASAFLEPEATVPVHDVKYLMLPARRATLGAYMNQLIPDGAPIRVEPAAAGDVAAVRVLTYRSRAPTAAQEAGLVWMDGSYLSISALVTVHLRERAFPALFLLHDFTDNPFLLQAIRELTVGPTSSAKIEGATDGWFSSTQPISKVLSLSTMMLCRNASSAPLVWAPLADIFAVQGLDPSKADKPFAPIRELWPEVAAVRPLLSVGTIESPGSSTECVSRRVMLTTYDAVETLREVSAPAGDKHVMQFHHSESFPIVDQLGLLTLPQDDALAGALRDGARGRVDAVPIVGFGEAAYRVELTAFRVLWEAHRTRAPA